MASTPKHFHLVFRIFFSCLAQYVRSFPYFTSLSLVLAFPALLNWFFETQVAEDLEAHPIFILTVRFLTTVLAMGALVNGIHFYITDRTIDLKQAYARCISKYFTYLLLHIITSLIIGLPSLFFALMEFSRLFILKSLIGCFFHTFLLIAPAALFLENRNPLASVKRSFRLVKDQWFQVFCILVLFKTLEYLIRWSLSRGLEFTSPIPNLLINYGCLIFFITLQTILLIKVYHHLKFRDEAQNISSVFS